VLTATEFPVFGVFMKVAKNSWDMIDFTMAIAWNDLRLKAESNIIWSLERATA